MSQSDIIFIDGLPPVKAHATDAAYDLRSQESVMVEPYEPTLIDCGFAIAIPEGYVGLVCPRSGMALKNSVTVLNAPGVIDSGYRGNVGVILMNLGGKDFPVLVGDRVAQLLIVPAPIFTLQQNKNALERPTDRGDAGFGSTGVSNPHHPANTDPDGDGWNNLSRAGSLS